MTNNSETWCDELSKITKNVRDNNNRLIVLFIEDQIKRTARKGFFSYSCSVFELSRLGYEIGSYDKIVVVEKLRDQGLKVVEFNDVMITVLWKT